MENPNGIYGENLCPECGCNITEAREEENKKRLFETRHGEELIFIRKRARQKRILIGAIVFMLFALFLIPFVPKLGPGLFITKSGFNYLPFIVIAYGLIGAWWGTMYKGLSREEKRLWKNFI